jgi:hypothetical protein
MLTFTDQRGRDAIDTVNRIILRHLFTRIDLHPSTYSVENDITSVPPLIEDAYNTKFYKMSEFRSYRLCLFMSSRRLHVNIRSTYANDYGAHVYNSIRALSVSSGLNVPGTPGFIKPASRALATRRLKATSVTWKASA